MVDESLGSTADATILNLHPINQAGSVSSQAPGDPSNSAKQLASASS